MDEAAVFAVWIKCDQPLVLGNGIILFYILFIYSCRCISYKRPVVDQGV